MHSQPASHQRFTFATSQRSWPSAGGLNFDLPGAAARRPRPVHDAQHQLQMVREPGSPYLDASPRRRECGTARGRPERLGMRLLSSRTRKIASQSARATRTPSRTASGSSPASARTSVKKDSMRWSIGRSTLAACEPRRAFSVAARGATVGKDYQWLLPARHGLSDAGRDDDACAGSFRARIRKQALVSFRASRAAGSGGRSGLMPSLGCAFSAGLIRSGNPLPLIPCRSLGGGPDSRCCACWLLLRALC